MGVATLVAAEFEVSRSPDSIVAGAYIFKVIPAASTQIAGWRGAPVRAFMGSLETRGQFGCSPPMHTDACLRYSGMGYQSAEIAIDKCDAGKLALVHSGGAGCNGHGARKEELAQSAKVGYRPCCARATHVSIPTGCALGEYSGLKGRGLASWTSNGPCAGRRHGGLLFRGGLRGWVLGLGSPISGFRRPWPLGSNVPS